MYMGQVFEMTFIFALVYVNIYIPILGLLYKLAFEELVTNKFNEEPRVRKLIAKVHGLYMCALKVRSVPNLGLSDVCYI